MTLPNVMSPERLVAFTATGSPVPLSIEAVLSDGIEARLEPPWIPVRVVIIGIRSFGENAMARQVSGVQGWSVDFWGHHRRASTATCGPQSASSLRCWTPRVAGNLRCESGPDEGSEILNARRGRARSVGRTRFDGAVAVRKPQKIVSYGVLGDREVFFDEPQIACFIADMSATVERGEDSRKRLLIGAEDRIKCDESSAL